MKYSTLIPFGLACFANANILAARARCTDRCAVAIASDSNPAVHSSQMDDCQAYLGTTYYPTVSVLHTATMTEIRNNDGPTLAPNTAEESRYSAHLSSGTPATTSQIVTSTAPPHYAAELCQQPLFGFQGVFRAYSSACACASAQGMGVDAPIYTKVYTKTILRTASRFKILAIPEERKKLGGYLNVRIGTLPQDGGAIPTRLTNDSQDATVFEFTPEHNLRIHHSELVAGADREEPESQIAGGETRFSGFNFGWSPTARISKFLLPQTFIVDMQIGRIGHQLRTIVNQTYSTDLVAIDDVGIIHLPVGDRHDNEKPIETKELKKFYRLEVVELE